MADISLLLERVESLLPIPEDTQAAGYNVGQAERLASVVGGSALLAYGLIRRSVPGSAMALAGAGLLYRGFTGHCEVYDKLGVNTTPKDNIHEGGVLVERNITINKSPHELYEYWRDLSRLPSIMRHLESVTVISPTRSHWVAKAPAGRTVEWNAEIINDVPDEVIAWKSCEASQIVNEGSVRFKAAPGDRGTELKVIIKYHPPAGVVGSALAKLWGEEPSLQLDEDLHRFKQLMETGEIPTIEGQPKGK